MIQNVLISSYKEKNSDPVKRIVAFENENQDKRKYRDLGIQNHTCEKTDNDQLHKELKHTVSIFDCLNERPNLVSDLLDMLIIFRRYAIGMVEEKKGLCKGASYFLGR